MQWYLVDGVNSPLVSQELCFKGLVLLQLTLQVGRVTVGLI